MKRSQSPTASPGWELVDYRGLTLKTLTSPRFRHLLLLLFWPVFGLAFAALERLRTTGYTAVYSPIDDMIPFCEGFAIPYFFWFVYLVAFYLYALLFDVDAFKRYTVFIIITYSVTLLIYLLWPTKQELRPTVFPRDNFLTDVMKGFYQFDTNTNVLPSLHVVGAVAVSSAARNSRHFSKVGWRIAFTATTVLIILSTVFLKQHSVLDIPPALVICAAAYPIAFGRRSAGRAREEHESEPSGDPGKKRNK